MMTFKYMTLFLAFLFSLNHNPITCDITPDPEPGNHYLLAADLFHTLVKAKSSENIIFSPLSLETVLTMAFAGAEGKTAEDLRKFLKLQPEDKSHITKNFAEFLKSNYQRNSNTKTNAPQLLLANRLFVADKFKISTEFNKIAEENFDALAENVNFAEAKIATDKINNWVEQQTQHKIQNLLQENDIEALTNIVLVNGIYFKGNWKYAFNKQQTKPAEFQLNSKEKTQVEMMHITGTFKYADLPELEATALDLPYNNSDISMLFVLPNKVEGLEQLESKLQSLDCSYIYKRLAPAKVCVDIPKFRMEHEQDLQPALEQLGLSIIFSDKADFSGMFDLPANQHISAVKQKTVFEIDELGSEAAASSAVAGICRRGIRSFYADHPFIFAIRNGKAIYFGGHIAKF